MKLGLDEQAARWTENWLNSQAQRVELGASNHQCTPGVNSRSRPV